MRLGDDMESQIQAMLEAMSLAQKVAQMTMAERMWATPEEAAEYGLGAILSGGGSHPGGNKPADWVAMNDAYWQAMMASEVRLNIPILFGVDAVHGHNNVSGATIFPHNIALGAADDANLVARVATATAREVLASGLEWNFAPTLAVAQNCQWGRTYESFGSDPARVGRLGEAYVKALQSEGVMACVKHWVGDGATLHGIDQGETTLTWQELERTHIAPYYRSLVAGVGSVMVSFSSWNGEKCHAHHHLITEVLKAQLKFDGIVVSDWDGIDYLAEDYQTAIAQSVNAGLDMFMVPEKWRDFIVGLIHQVECGAVELSRINDAVARILRTKFKFGLFDLPRPAARPGSHAAAFGSHSHREVAREVVQRSQVLLKNNGDILPLGRHQSVLVAGRNAHDLGHQCGGWTESWQGESGNDKITGATIWDGIKRTAGAAELSSDLSGREANPDRHDVAVVVIGERPYAEGFGDIRRGDDLLIEAGSMVNGLMNPLEPYGRTLELAKLHPQDLACIKRICAQGVPVVAVLISGRPLIVREEMDLAGAFVAAWLPGSEGQGVADALFGNVGYGGRLPLPWPREMATDSSSDYRMEFPEGFGLTTVAFDAEGDEKRDEKRVLTTLSQ